MSNETDLEQNNTVFDFLVESDGETLIPRETTLSPIPLSPSAKRSAIRHLSDSSKDETSRARTPLTVHFASSEKNQVKVFEVVTPVCEEDAAKEGEANIVVLAISGLKKTVTGIIERISIASNLVYTNPSSLDDAHGGTETSLSWSAYLLLVVNSIGIIYGDIGTSPIYVFKSILLSNFDPVLAEIRKLPAELRVYQGDAETHRQTEIYGIVSTVIWLLILIPTFKYMIFILKADNQGEGGTFALVSLLPSQEENPRLKSRKREKIFMVAMLGASFLLGDGIVTPAISVLSAVEGISTYASQLTPFVIPLTCALLLALFLLQKYGTAKVGMSFAPIMMLWFISIGLIGLYRVSFSPKIFNALKPSKIVEYAINIGSFNFFKLIGTAFVHDIYVNLQFRILVITGVEAMYADLSHFRKGPIRTSWICIAFPSLVFQYLGQGAGLLEDAAREVHPFYLAIPARLRWPMLFLATLSSIIASQALISGSFALIYQAIQLKILPRIRYFHTSDHNKGQVYIPLVNYALMTGSLLLIVIFRDSDSLANLYGITVTGDMALTSVFYCLVMFYAWRTPLILIICYIIAFGLLDIVLFSSALMKIPAGGWVSIAISLALSSLMLSWYTSNRDLEVIVQEHETRVQDFAAKLEDCQQSQKAGLGIFVASREEDIPASLIRYMDITDALPCKIICLTFVAHPSAYYEATSKAIVRKMDGSKNAYHMAIQYGFRESDSLDIHGIIQAAVKEGLIVYSGEDVRYFTSRELVKLDKTGMTFQRKVSFSIFLVMLNALGSVSDRYSLPPAETTELGEYLIFN